LLERATRTSRASAVCAWKTTLNRCKTRARLYLCLATYLSLAIFPGSAQVLEVLDCPCTDEQGECKTPVCPKGFYKCCFDCGVSTCAKQELGYWPNGDLWLSDRGVMECIQCKSGDYCSGCDVFEECPRETTTFGQESRSLPKISPAGSILARECQRCPDGYEADVNRDRCVPMFRRQCDMKLLELCILGCRDNPTNDECEDMSCKLYCANAQKATNPECLLSFAETCDELNAARDLLFQDSSLTLTTTPNPTLLFSDDSGIATIAPIIPVDTCILMCSFATRLPLSFMTILSMAMAGLLGI